MILEYWLLPVFFCDNPSQTRPFLSTTTGLTISFSMDPWTNTYDPPFFKGRYAAWGCFRYTGEGWNRCGVGLWRTERKYQFGSTTAMPHRHSYKSSGHKNFFRSNVQWESVSPIILIENSHENSQCDTLVPSPNETESGRSATTHH